MTLPEYLQTMRVDGEWIDTVFMHASGVAHAVSVLIIQAGMDGGVVGIDLLDLGKVDLVEYRPSEIRGPPTLVPIALQSDRHTWCVVQPDAPA